MKMTKAVAVTVGCLTMAFGAHARGVYDAGVDGDRAVRIGRVSPSHQDAPEL